MEIGNKIKFHRSRLKISQEEFAEKIFVSSRLFQIGKMIKPIQI